MADTGAVLMTDGDRTLGAIGRDYAGHQAVNHRAGEYARGDAHTNTVESFHLYAQRAKFGVWHRWSDAHQDRYLDELAFHWVHRPRFQKVNGKRHRTTKATSIILRMQQIFRNAGGRRLTYKKGSIIDNAPRP